MRKHSHSLILKSPAPRQPSLPNLTAGQFHSDHWLLIKKNNNLPEDMQEHFICAQTKTQEGTGKDFFFTPLLHLPLLLLLLITQLTQWTRYRKKEHFSHVLRNYSSQCQV